MRPIALRAVPSLDRLARVAGAVVVMAGLPFAVARMIADELAGRAQPDTAAPLPGKAHIS